jgi:hypothetical protein
MIIHFNNEMEYKGYPAEDVKGHGCGEDGGYGNRYGQGFGDGLCGDGKGGEAVYINYELCIGERNGDGYGHGWMYGGGNGNGKGCGWTDVLG